MATKDAKKGKYIRQQIKLWDDNWKINRDQYYLYTTFVLGEQWTEDESRVFENYRKIPLTFNKLAPLIAHLLGEQRQNTPQLQCCPEDHVDEQAAEVREALVKDISLSSHAKIQYQTAFQQAAVGGFGALVLETEYEHEMSFNQQFKITSLKDPCRAFWDMGAQTPAKTDGMHAGYRTRMTRKRFRALYGKKLEKMIPSSVEENSYALTDALMGFDDDRSITIIDWYEREYAIEKIHQLSNGKVVNSKDLRDLEKIEIEDGKEVLIYNGEPVTIVDTRDSHNFTVTHEKWAGDYKLEETECPTKQLPVVFVDQNSYYDKLGRQLCRPFIKDAKDAQKYLNYLGTQSAYVLKISRYDQFLVSKANVKSADTQTIWRDPSTVQGGLIYDESPNGNIPQQLHPPELSQSLVTQYERTLMDIQSSTGMYNTQIGEQGNEVSGKAIDSRTRRGSFSTFVPFDSLNRAIAVIGELINEGIPVLYDTQRSLKLNMKDKGMTDVTINKPKDEYSDELENDMSKGRFKIRLMPGASFEGQKQENLEALNTVLQADRAGTVFPMIADLYVENLDLANSLELKNRLRTLVPPEIIQAGKTGEPIPKKDPQPDPMIMIKIQELQQKKEDAMRDAQFKMLELNHKHEEMMAKSHIDGASFAAELAKIDMQKEETQAKLIENERRYDAEIRNINAKVHMHHTGNIAKILTHQPNHFKADNNKESMSDGNK